MPDYLDMNCRFVEVYDLENRIVMYDIYFRDEWLGSRRTFRQAQEDYNRRVP